MAEADPQIADSEVAATTEAMPPSPVRRRWGRIAAMVSLPLLLLVGGFLYWQSLQGQVATDNAYVKQDDARIGAEADAAIASAQASVTALENSSDLSGADIAAAREDIAFARSRLERQEQLWERGFTTKADLDAARHAVAQAQEDLHQAQARQVEARAKLARGAAVPDRNPQVAIAEAQEANARLQLRRTEVRAPVSGRVAQADRLQAGQQIVPSLPVLTLVADDSTYVEANFKETDLDEMRPGQRAELRFDAYPGIVLRGHVASIGAGTGSQFSVLPAQNATGNWVKVTQRVPVRISIDEESPRPLLAGLSTHVTVFTAD